MESSQRPTPETAAAIYTATFGTVKHTAVHPNVAIKLERERDEAREEIAAMREAIREAHNLVRWLVPNSDGLHHRTATAALAKLQPFLP